ncbi:peptidase A4 family-domain-containing protein [Boletus edulis BED1]|uniref:Peptidase A4 family-domain-containing protein n=1 Tax=Boletus edulis BED1 TaxID=1328754 RepID=A0AAD4GCR9_BOLED|nr:peptidase A4 family-domain-containing protein [Boletus edulis BED1]
METVTSTLPPSTSFLSVLLFLSALSSPEAHLLPFSQMENHSNLLLNLPHHPLKLAVRSIAPAQNHPLHFTKRVHFPEKDDDLATIRVYDRSAHPAALSNLANDNGDLTETEGEVAPSARFPFPSLSSVLDYEIDPTKSSPDLSSFRRRGSEPRLLDLVERAANATSDGVEYTPNWAGAVYLQDTGTIVMVSGVIAVPDMSAVEAGSVASAWVGIDGDTCKSTALMTGVVFGKTQNGPFYQAMYWSPPDTTVTPENITISAGDVVRLTVGALVGPTVLQFTLVENLSNKQFTIKFQRHSRELCGQNAEYVQYNTWSANLKRRIPSVRPIQSIGCTHSSRFLLVIARGLPNHSPLGITRFINLVNQLCNRVAAGALSCSSLSSSSAEVYPESGTIRTSMVAFTDAMAFAKGNQTSVPQEATVIDIQENGQVLTSASVSVDNSSAL